ncbi:MAG: response regulator [Deltaproteobacteria bacterium]|nr:response regulator [Deltaproteobacteria bacterium]
MSPLQSLDRNMPILVVDDLSAMRRIVKNCLRKLGFENIVEAENAQSAMQVLESGDFKFVISDWNLEVVKGNEFLNAARQHEKLKNVPFLIVAAEAHKQAAAQVVADESGVIVKPFTADLLQQKMEAILSK